MKNVRILGCVHLEHHPFHICSITCASYIANSCPKCFKKKNLFHLLHPEFHGASFGQNRCLVQCDMRSTERVRVSGHTIDHQIGIYQKNQRLARSTYWIFLKILEHRQLFILYKIAFKLNRNYESKKFPKSETLGGQFWALDLRGL
jgi:hypothetical protein